jgi:hypothetical protein
MSQPFFSDRTAVDETPQSIRQTNAIHLSPTLRRIVIGIGQARRRAIFGERKRCPPIGIVVSEVD